MWPVSYMWQVALLALPFAWWLGTSRGPVLH